MLLHLIKLILIFIYSFLGLIIWTSLSKLAVDRCCLIKIHRGFILHQWIISELVVFVICNCCWIVSVLRIINVRLELLLVLILINFNISENIFIIFSIIWLLTVFIELGYILLKIIWWNIIILIIFLIKW